MNFLVSIITPSYNFSAFISQTINSVLSQTYTNWEMIIVDDCSTDNSAEVIKKYCDKEPRIKYLRTNIASGSPTKLRNMGILNAKGRYIAFWDSDDIWLPNKLELQLSLFREDNVAIVYSYYEKISEDRKCAGRVIKCSKLHTYRSLI